MIGEERFLDGGFGLANNPTWHALIEVCQMSANSPEAVALTVSIGTGKGDKVLPVAKRGAGLWGQYKAIIKYSAATTTDSEATHLRVDQLCRQTHRWYERFNVDRDLGNINLGEWKVRKDENLTLKKIRQLTRAYLDLQETQARLLGVAEELVRVRQERSHDPKWDIVATGRRYRCSEDRCTMHDARFGREDDLRLHLAEAHVTLGYVWPPNTPEEEAKMKMAVGRGTILHAD